MVIENGSATDAPRDQAACLDGCSGATAENFNQKTSLVTQIYTPTMKSFNLPLPSDGCIGIDT